MPTSNEVSGSSPTSMLAILGFIISAASGGSHGFITSVHGSSSYTSLIWLTTASSCVTLFMSLDSPRLKSSLISLPWPSSLRTKILSSASLCSFSTLYAPPLYADWKSSNISLFPTCRYARPGFVILAASPLCRSSRLSASF